MSDARKPPVFLQRPRYRRRRLQDAGRMFPIFGGGLVMIPLIWPSAEEGGVSTVSAFAYIFGIWALMIALAAILAPFLARQDRE